MGSNERRLKIIYMLQSGKRITVDVLAGMFDVSRRTIFRDMRIIQDLGVPVTHESEMGYGVMREATIPPIMFSFRELSVVMMGLSFVGSQIDPDMVEDAKNVSLKIRNAIPHSLQERMNSLESGTIVSPYIHNIEKRKKGGDWYLICTSFAEKRAVRFLYSDRKGKTSTRLIDPHTLIHYTDHWNVIGFCHDRKALRNFVLDRMTDVTLTDEPFISDTNYSRDELLYGRLEKEYTVTVEIAREKAFSFLSTLPGKITERKDLSRVIRLSFLIDNLDYINEWMLGFGLHLHIISPASLKKKRAVLLEKMLGSELQPPAG